MKRRILLPVLALVPAFALSLVFVAVRGPSDAEIETVVSMNGLTEGGQEVHPRDVAELAPDKILVSALPKATESSGYRWSAKKVENRSGYNLGHIPPGISEVERVLYRQINTPDARGLTRRTHVLETDFHFPLVQTVELTGVNEMTGEEEVVAYQSMVADHIIVQLISDQLPENWENQLAEEGLKIRREVTREGLYLMEFDVVEAGQTFAMIEKLETGYPWVRFAEPDHVAQTLSHEDPIPNDPWFGELWGLQNTGQIGGRSGFDIKAVDGWLAQTRLQEARGEEPAPGSASSVIVAVLDTGVDYNHFDLKENMWVNPRETRDGRDSDGNGFIDDIHGANMVTGSGNPMDFDGHGTHVAGTIGAVGNNNNGIVGVAWDVQLMAISILNPGGTVSDIIRGIDYAWQNGADILNNSWGVVMFNAGLFGQWRSEAMTDAIVRVKNANAIFVVAAGNDGLDVDTFVDYPAGSQWRTDNVVNVGALDRMGNLAFFSNYGPRTVHIAAPGHEILSTVPGNGYATSSGTSMAAPHVSGILAILKAEYPNETYDQLIQRLLQRSEKEKHLSSYVGIGRRPNLARALDPKPLIAQPLEDFEFLPGRDVTLEIGVSSSGGPAEIQWFKDGALLPGETGTSLSLGYGERSLNGVYRAEVTNAYGTSTTQAIVKELPTYPELGDALGATDLTWTTSEDAPWVVVAEDGLSAARSAAIGHGETSILSTNVVGPGTVSFSWKVSSEQRHDSVTFLINGEQVESRSGDRDWVQRTYDIPAGLQTLTWSYSKDLSGSAGLDSAWLADVVYENDIPLIATQTSSLEVVVGTTVTLSLEAKGKGPLTYFWEKDGQLLAGENNAELLIEDAAYSDAGSYTATVSNVHGTAVALPITVSVVEVPNPPLITRNPVGIVGPEGSRVVLSAAWSGTQPFTLQWYKDGEAIPGATADSLTLTDLTIGDSGSYHLTVSNAAGSTESFLAQVHIQPAREKFTEWVERHGGLDAVMANGDPNVPAFLRFALGNKPGEGESPKLPRLALVEEPTIEALAVNADIDEASPKYAALLFTIPALIEGVTYSLEVSDDLLHWETAVATLETLEVFSDGSRAVQLRELEPVDSDLTRRFLRLRVEPSE